MTTGAPAARPEELLAEGVLLGQGAFRVGAPMDGSGDEGAAMLGRAYKGVRVGDNRPILVRQLSRALVAAPGAR